MFGMKMNEQLCIWGTYNHIIRSKCFPNILARPWVYHGPSFFWQGLEETADGFGCFGVYEPTGLFPNANRVDEKDV
jgi:hypothetical protein